MNQILEIKNDDNNKNINQKNNKNKKILFFKTQLSLSIITIAGLLFSIFFFYTEINNYNKVSKTLSDNYSIYKLYASQNNKTESNFSGIVGKIMIPKINIEYPLYYTLDEEQLKITPCILQGNIDNTDGNLCIAGHNYNNDKFFSNLYLLSVEDEIFIYNNYDEKYNYKIFSKYEVETTDLSPLYNIYEKQKIITLITCNNSNGKKIIIQAKKESL